MTVDELRALRVGQLVDVYPSAEMLRQQPGTKQFRAYLELEGGDIVVDGVVFRERDLGLSVGGFWQLEQESEGFSVPVSKDLLIASSPTFAFTVRLRSERARLGWTQAELAKRAGLHPTAISHFEKGSRSPSLENLCLLATTLDTSTDYLCGLTTVRGKVAA